MSEELNDSGLVYTLQHLSNVSTDKFGRPPSNLNLSESLVFSPHMHAVFHSYVSKDMVTLPIVAKHASLYRVEFIDSAEEEHYYLATLYYGREARRHQINQAIDQVMAILTLRLA